MTLTPQPTAWAMPVACSEACEARMDPDFLGPGPHPHAPASAHPTVASQALPCSPISTSTPAGLMLWPWDPAELGEGSAPEEVGVHAGPGPLAHPPFQGTEGPKL